MYRTSIFMKYLCHTCRSTHLASRNVPNRLRISRNVRRLLSSSLPVTSGRSTGRGSDDGSGKSPTSTQDGDKLDMSQFPVKNIRNFSIIAHVDHGKSTLADRLLELTGTISRKTDNKQVLDKLQVERERGITVKAQTASMVYNYQGQKYLLNLIDTPGHVDFNYEVSRSLAACQGVLLLVDANQGVQAQTVANFYLAFESDLTIIPVINKIDLKLADPERVSKQLDTLFDIQDEEVLKISAKVGTGIDQVLPSVIERVPPPPSCPDRPMKGLLLDSWYNQYRGAFINFALVDGVIRKGDKVVSAHSQKTYEVQEVGVMHPEPTPTAELYAGQVGYVVPGIYNIKEAHMGDTYYHQNSPVEPLPGFKPARPMVFAGLYPMDQSEYIALRSAIEKLTLNDSSVSVSRDSSPALGQGWRLGFLGLLHMEVFNQRLEQEHNANVIVTVPSVPFKATLKDTKANKQEYGDDLQITVYNPSVPLRASEILPSSEDCLLFSHACKDLMKKFPDVQRVEEYLEPMVIGTIIAPDEHISKILSLCLSKRGEQEEYTYIDATRVLLKYKLPLNEIVVDFFDQLKSISSGYASFDYEDCGYQQADLVKLSILLNGREVEELATVVHQDKARESGKAVCNKLKESIPRQLYEVAIQASIGSRIVARENVRALRKNVLAKCYGGDITRKMKLLRRQAEGKKRMKKFGNVEVPKDAFISVLKR